MKEINMTKMEVEQTTNKNITCRCFHRATKDDYYVMGFMSGVATAGGLFFAGAVINMLFRGE